MNELTVKTNEKVMTVKEIADSLSVSTDTIKNCIRRILPKKMQNGKTTFLNEKEVSMISKELKGNNKVTEQLTYETASQVKNSYTDEEIILNAQLAFKALDNLRLKKIAELEQQKEILQIELDQSKEYITIKRMEKLNPNEHFNWRVLKKESERLKKPSKNVFDANYGNVKAYHVSVWESLYFDSINYPM